MKDGKPSQTASMVACMRALADRGLTLAQGFRDPTAATLLSPGWGRVLGWVERRLRRMPEARRRRVLSRLDILPLRTLAIDTAVKDAVAGGSRQVVILGAGLDGRAYRMSELAGCRVFEVDHPATQAYKREKAAALTRACAELTWVAVDFEHDSLAERLAASGHQGTQPTVWIWEGVTMYLTDAALRATLDAVASRSSPGSVLLVQYGEPRRGAWRKLSPMGPLLALWSEPQIGARSRETIRAELERARWSLRADSGVADWAVRFGGDPPSAETARTRLAVAAR